VWLSLGADGSLLSTRDGTWRLTPPPSRAIVNAVGCGDALVGGLAAGLVRGLDLLEAARLGTAAATDKLAWLHPPT
jgi:fructose-1-phosphate kinase PfkB-like protein